MKPKYTNICAFLRKCFFNPNKLGPLKIISDIGNADYYEQRAIEFIKEAPLCHGKATISQTFKEALENYDDKIIKAIQLLSLARETRHHDAQIFLKRDPRDNESKDIGEKEKT